MSKGSSPTPYRPALVALTEDVRERTEELRRGLDSEARVLEWVQELTIRTLGRIDTRVYTDLARQYRSPLEGRRRPSDRHVDGSVLLAALLKPGARRESMADLDDELAESLRERFLATYIHPAHRSAFRELRKDATEYVVDGDEGDEHDPHRQRHVAMRPALSELEGWQQRALEGLLDGFESVEDVLDWGHDLLLATHGEIGREWVTRVVEESSTTEVLLGDEREHERARRLFAAYHVVPRYRAGVRVLSRRAGEVASDDEGPDREARFA